MGVCMCVCLCVCRFFCLCFVCVFAGTHVCMHTCVYMYHTRACTCVYIHMYIKYVHTQAYILMYTYTCIYVFVCVDMCTRMLHIFLYSAGAEESQFRVGLAGKFGATTGETAIFHTLGEEFVVGLLQLHLESHYLL